MLVYILLYAIFFLFLPVMAWGDDLGVPDLLTPVQQENFFNPNRLSISFGQSRDSVPTYFFPYFEPQLGLDYSAREEGLGDLKQQTTYMLHGEAGGKLHILENLSLLAVLKIPLYSYEKTDIAPGVGPSSQSDSRLMNDLSNFSIYGISWRGELGIKLAPNIDLNLFYDRTNLNKGNTPTNTQSPEDKFGTSIIFKF